jgi:hypothetical protein
LQSELLRRHEAVETRLRKAEPEDLIALEIAVVSVDLLPVWVALVEVELFQAGMGPAMVPILQKHAKTWGDQRNAMMNRWIGAPDTLDEDKLLGWVGEVSKGRFAQALAGSATAAVCPEYIRKALAYVKNGFSPDEL